MRLWLNNTTVTNTITSALVDLAVGAAASEVVKVANIDAGQLSTIPNLGGFWEFPLFIPSGSRIAFRNQSVVSADTVDAQIDLFYGGRFLQYTGKPPTTYGANTATSRGVDTAAGLSGVEGSWQQITSATTAAHRGLLVSFSGAGDQTILSSDYTYDIGVGTAGNEVAVASDLVIGSTTAEIITPRAGSTRVDGLYIPAGSALSVRLSSSQGSAQSLDFILHGLE